jgi:hypothetical protein
MKKIVAVAAAAVLTMGLAACAEEATEEVVEEPAMEEVAPVEPAMEEVAPVEGEVVEEAPMEGEAAMEEAAPAE